MTVNDRELAQVWKDLICLTAQLSYAVERFKGKTTITQRDIDILNSINGQIDRLYKILRVNRLID